MTPEICNSRWAGNAVRENRNKMEEKMKKRCTGRPVSAGATSGATGDRKNGSDYCSGEAEPQKTPNSLRVPDSSI